MPFTEANFENAILEIFRDLLGYETLYGPDVVRDFAEPLCLEMLDEALVRLNPSLPRAAIDEAIARIRNIESGSLARKNARFTDMLQNGVAVNYFDGSEQRAGLVRLVAQPVHGREPVDGRGAFGAQGRHRGVCQRVAAGRRRAEIPLARGD